MTAWLDISSAPKDGTEIILCRGKRVGAAAWISWPGTHDEEAGSGWTIGQDGDAWDGEQAPAHWQPLPAPPGKMLLAKVQGGANLLHVISGGDLLRRADAIAPRDRFGGANGWRLIDRRLQALRKKGDLTYSSKAGWSVVASRHPT